MRIAVLDQHGNPGGGVRFVRALVEGLAESCSDDEIGLFVSAPVLTSEPVRLLVEGHSNVLAVEIAIPEPTPVGDAGPATDTRATVETSNESIAKGGRLRATLRRITPLVRAYRRLRGLPALESAPAPTTPPPALLPDPSFRLDSELIGALAGYDVLYLAWPYFIEPVDLPIPVVGTFHDFNYRHDFGNYAPERIAILERQIPAWLECAAGAVVSTDFIRQELARFYPDDDRAVDVIPLASFATSRPSDETVAEVIRQFGLLDGYVLYPCNIAKHKNLAGLFSAWGLLKAHVSPAPPLVLCGYGTDLIAGQIEGTVSDGYLAGLVSEISAAGLVVGADLHLLGYVTDAEVDALVSGAMLVISPSTYEAGSGPALDAWLLGTPVALSGIPAHREQVERLETDAWFFDEADPGDIARVIEQALGGDSREMVRRSADALRRYNWNVVAGRYREAFDRALARTRAGDMSCE